MFVLLNFARCFKIPCLERASGLFNLYQPTMAAASAARTALYGRFGLTEPDLLASVGAGAPLVNRFY